MDGLVLDPAAYNASGVTIEESYTAKDDQFDQMPDVGNRKVMRALRCSSCNQLTTEIYTQLVELTEKKKKAGRRPKSYEIAEVTEVICPTLRDEYGLVLKNKKPTNIFSKDKALTRMTGAWVNSFIDTRCGEMLDAWEDQIIEEYESVTSVDDMKRLVCIKWEKTCKEEEIIDEL